MYGPKPTLSGMMRSCMWFPHVNCIHNMWHISFLFFLFNIFREIYYRIKRFFSGVYLCITWTIHSQTNKSPNDFYESLWVTWSRLYINKLRKKCFNPYSSVTKFFFSFVLKIYLWGSPIRTHTFHWCVSAWITKWTNLV